MKTEKEIRETFDLLWKLYKNRIKYSNSESYEYIKGILKTLVWVMDENLLEEKIDEVIK